MNRFVARTPIDQPGSALWDWHMRPGAFKRLTPPWEPVRVVQARWPPTEGSRAVLEVKLGPFRRRWVALHQDFVPGERFTDLQESGPFAYWSHTHRFSADRERRASLEDAIDYRLPFEPVSRWLAGGRVRERLRRTFAFRHAVTRADLERHAAFADRPRLRVAISGASGLVGSGLAAFLEGGGHRVVRIVRDPRTTADAQVAWHTSTNTFDLDALAQVDAVVHLAGENIASGRWTDARKQRIRDSRVDGTRALARALASLPPRPRVLVSASAIGYYGNRGDETLDEDSAPGGGFLPRVCREWEAASELAEDAARVVQVRIGVVQASAGGALAKMKLPFGLGLGGRFGDGRQWVSWIALEDLIGVIHHCLFDERLRGPVNAVAPGAVRQAELTRVLARVMRRPAFMHVPAPVLRGVLGELGRELLLAGARIVSSRLERVGFRFRHPDLEGALRAELGIDGGLPDTRFTGGV